MEGNYYDRKLGILTDTRDGSNEMEANFQSEMGFLRVWPLTGMAERTTRVGARPS